MGLGRLFDLGRRSLATYQRALDVTSHNIANASNPNYSRQVIGLKTERPEQGGGYLWGTGVTLSQIQRVRNGLIDGQIRSNNQNYFGNAQKSVILSQVEELFTEPSELGLSNLTSQFFNSFQELSSSPNSQTLRQGVLRSAEQLSSKVKNIYDSMDVIKGNLLTEMNTKTTELNSKLKLVQSLNAQVYESQASGFVPNDLMDRRDEVIDEISKYANVTITYDDKNVAQIAIGGTFAADGVNFTEFKVVESKGRIGIAPSNSDVSATLTSGELGAIADTYSETIPAYKRDLDAFMNTFVDSINNIHTKGFTLDVPPQTGIHLFEKFTDGNLKINNLISEDLSKLAVSGDGTNGNGTIATSIANLENAKLLNGVTLSSHYSNLMSRMGNDKLTFEQNAEASAMIVDQLEQQKLSYSGVSVDEEMTNIIKYQRSYDASAKLIKVADEMLQTILNMV